MTGGISEIALESTDDLNGGAILVVAVPAEETRQIRVVCEGAAAEPVVREGRLVPALRGLELRAGEELCHVPVAEDRKSQTRVGGSDG